MAQAATSMTPEQVKKIKANCEDIVKRVQADDIMDYFVDEDYFSIEDVAENIMSGKTPQHQTERLVMLLQQKRSKAGIFDFFLNQLARHGNKDLAKKIRETEEGDDRFPEIPEKLKNKMVTERYAMHLSKTFPAQHLITFGVCLGLSDVDISHVKADNMQYGVSTVIWRLITVWKNRNGRSATLEKLHNLFQNNSDSIELNPEAYAKALDKIIKS
ncbi:Death domain-containing protein CRADD [Mizuhopecten yessoensis]|uniref:Death domain-containing protein CRADD n=1 Tax=Mizuhopecten yessoensis TaxID=6573 RepID=A0A210PWW7_MIZYE|nr:Death domain-containing protein CRADD [Mizuhopecten yessoensis]